MEHLNKWMGVRRAGECGGAGREGPCVCVLEWDDGPTGVRVSERCHLLSDFRRVAMDMPTLLRDPKTRWCETFEQNWCLHSTQELYTSKTASEFLLLPHLRSVLALQLHGLLVSVEQGGGRSYVYFYKKNGRCGKLVNAGKGVFPR